jgi:hypothetical protein
MDQVKLQLEDFGGAPEVSPQLRYAQIHRDLEKGLNSERLWIELVEVCLRLDKVGEAGKAMSRVYTPQEALRLSKLFEGFGVVFAGSSSPPGLLGDVSGVDPQSLGTAKPAKNKLKASIAHGPGEARPAHREDPPAGPSAREAAARKRKAESRAKESGEAHPAHSHRMHEEETVLEQFQDAAAYLFVDHMPLAAIGFTLLFPALASIFFLLPAGLDLEMRALITSIPALMGVGLLLHAGRRILRASSEGEEDPPALLERSVQDSPRVLVGFVILSAVSFLPAVGLSMTPAPIYSILALALLGLAYFPMAVLGTAMSGSLSAASPKRVAQGIGVAPRAYLAVVGIVLAAFVLPTWLILTLMGKTVFLQAAVTGPLLVGPCLVLGRLLGRFWYVRSNKLAGVFGVTLTVQSLSTFRETARQAASRMRSESRASAWGQGEDSARRRQPPRPAQQPRHKVQQSPSQPPQPPQQPPQQPQRQQPQRQQPQRQQPQRQPQRQQPSRQPQQRSPQQPRSSQGTGSWRATGAASSRKPAAQQASARASATRKVGSTGSTGPKRELNSHRHTPLRKRS